MRPLLWAAILGLCSTSLMAAPPRGFSFAYKDWEVACDNTGTCRAAGYGATMGEVSVLLTRSAGPGRQATAQVTFAQTEHDIPPDASVNLFINDNDRGALEAIDDSHFHFDSTQTSALITALEQNAKIELALTGHVTHFTLTYADDAPVSTTKPAADISDDEWQAFLHSDISADSENGKVSFTLIDLDGDGKRDLIIDSYVGGTGLFSYTGVLKRGDSAFESVNNADSNDDDNFDAGVPGALYSINDRGANQWGRWIRINGQVYALWFNGVFGEDNLYLLRPFNQSDLTPAITIRYRYNLNIISAAENEQPPPPRLKR